MKHLRIHSLLIALLAFSSCIEHEVIPPPRPVVDLECSFTGLLDGAEYSLIENVGGLFCDPAKSKEILPLPQPSTATYFATIRSDDPLELDFIQVKLGKLLFNAELAIDPSIEQFTEFFMDNLNPDFARDADGGVEVIFRDPNGGVWRSSPDGPLGQFFTFVNIEQESDEDGDYLKFVANFNTTLYDDIDDPTAEIQVQNAVYIGYFQR